MELRWRKVRWSCVNQNSKNELGSSLKTLEVLGLLFYRIFLFDDGKRYRLLLGGYADCEVIEKTLMQLNERGNYWPKAIHVD